MSLATAIVIGGGVTGLSTAYRGWFQQSGGSHHHGSALE